MKYVFLFLLLASCTSKVKIEGVDNPKVDFDLGFKRAAEFCDERYLPNREAAEDCFKDYRKFTKITVGLDFESIVKFCRENYDNSGDIKACTEDLIDLFNGLRLGT